LARLRAFAGRALGGLGKSLLRLPGRILREPRLRLVALFVLVLTPIPVYCLWVLIVGPEPPKATLAAALASLDADDDPLAAYHATRLFEAEVYAPWNQGGPAYVLGVLAARHGQTAVGARQDDYWALAVSYLREARQLGFPAGRDAHGLFTLGLALASLGRHAESIGPLREALTAVEHDAAGPKPDGHATEHHAGEAAHEPAGHSPDQPSTAAIHRLLCTAYQRLPVPQLAEALEHSAKYLDGSHLSAEERDAALLERSQIYFELGQTQACREVLTQVPADSESRRHVLLIEAQLLLREARHLRESPASDESSRSGSPSPAAGAVESPRPVEDAALDKYRAALATLDAACRQHSLSDEVPLDALYLIGVCRLEMGDDTAAYQAFRDVVRYGAQEPAVAAAELRRAELLLRQGQPTDAMLALQGALRLARPADEYQNPWLPRAEFRRRVTDVHARLLNADELSLAVRLARLAYPLFTREEQGRLLAETHRACAQRLAEKEPASRGEKPVGEGPAAVREHHRRAAEAFGRLARLEFATPRYPEHLWSAAQSYEAAGDLAQAEAMLRAYLTHDVSPQERPQATFRLAQVQLALGKPREAAATLRECRDRYSRDPVVYSARLLASEACLRLENFDEARQALQENLDSDLSPASGEWRDSLFALGRLNSLRREWPEVVRVLEEAVTRYPDARQATAARYLIADAYVRMAKGHQQKSHGPNEEQRQQHERLRRHDLEAALAQLEQLVAKGLAAPEQGLDSLDRSTLRNARFAHVATLLELSRHEEAVRACAALINRYPDAPEVLEAYARMVGGLRRLNRADEARAAVAQARTVLEKLPDDASFANTTNQTRQEWKTFLEWLAKE
jgi:tetratricopeptide (TPR) repeat protein